jgi:hypothetical protein
VSAVSWLKLPIIGMPGTECGRRLLDGGTAEVEQSFKDEFGECEQPARWSIGMLLVCQEHAARVAADFGDDIAEIEAAWKRECL